MPLLQGLYPWPEFHDDTRILPEALQHKVLRQHIKEALSLYEFYPELFTALRFGDRSRHDLHYGSRSVFASGLTSDGHWVRIGVRLDRSAETLRQRAHKDNDLYLVIHAHYEHG